MISLGFPGLDVELRTGRVETGGTDPASGGTADRAGRAGSTRIVAGREVNLVLPRPAVDYYRHGWQSWSLACWHPVDTVVPVQKPEILHPMETDPVYAHRTDPAGSWVGAVRFEDGTVLLVGSLGTDARVEFRRDTLRATSEASGTDPQWFVAAGDEDTVFAGYADALGRRLGVAPGKPAPRIWCSWYSLYTAITEKVLTAVLPGLSEMPVDTIQVDDGWQVSVGDWSANEKFPSGMAALADEIRGSGRSAGLWLAPLIVTASSAVARNHPEWLLRGARGRPVSAGFNWGEQLYALDTTHPEAVDWLRDLMRTVREWGYDYLKLDFLYGGALPGVRNADVPREAAYRDGLRAIREAAGDAYLVTCGAPIVPSLGLCDALRIGPDVADFWTSRLDERILCNPAIPGTRNAVRTTLHRLWLESIVAVDPDVFYLTPQWNSLTKTQRKMTQALGHICSFKATSDLPEWLTAGGISAAAVKDAFDSATVTRTGRYVFEIDGERVDMTDALGVPGPRTAADRLVRALGSWLGNRPRVLRFNDAAGRRSAARRLASVERSRTG